MPAHRSVKGIVLVVALVAAAARVLAPGVATAQAARPALAPPTAAEIAAVRPLLARGAVVLVRDPDGGANARITIVTHAHAPPATVHRVIVTPEEYTSFMPALRTVEVLSRHGRRTAFRFHVSAPIFDVTALCNMNDVNDRRVDVQVLESETGPGGSRWDLVADGPSDTLVTLTTWGDPSQGHWLLRQVAQRSPAAVAGMNVSADTVLALGVARRAEILSGSRAPVRPARGTAPSGPLAPPAPGAWTELTRDATVIALGLDADGAVTQVTVATWTAGDADAVLRRLRDVPDYPRVWGSIRSIDVVANPSPDTVRYHLVTESPLTRLEGEQTRTMRGNVVTQDGVAGDFAGASHRWDVVPAPGGGAVVMLTGASDYNRAGWLTRALMERDPWLMAGFAGSWKIVWLRHLVHGL